MVGIWFEEKLLLYEIRGEFRNEQNEWENKTTLSWTLAELKILSDSS